MPNEWKPRLAARVDVRSLALTPAEGFMLSRVDGSTTVRELALLTQLPQAQVLSVLTRLVREGAVAESPDAPAAPLASTPSPSAPPATSAPAPWPLPPLTSSPSSASPVPALSPAPSPLPLPSDQGPGAAPDGGELDPGASPDPAEGPLDVADAATEQEREATAATHRQLFETRLHALPADERERLAATAREPELSALCFDPLSSVVLQVLENPNAGLTHGRLIAAHHRAPAGLERVVARAELARDAEVQRLLLRNPQLTETQLKRLVGPRRLLAVWKLTVSREVPERNRAGCSRQLRARFSTAAAEERVELILSTEGRALAGLTGLPVDGKTTSLLCKRTYSSALLVQNLARWSAAPPALIAHLLRQPMVMKNPHLRTLVSRHPNAPSEQR